MPRAQTSCPVHKQGLAMSFFDQTPAVFTQYSSTCNVVSREIDGGLMSIFTILFVVLLVAWLLGLSVFHVAGGFIHILLIFAVISLILHFVRGRSSTA